MSDPERGEGFSPAEQVPLRQRPIHEIAGILQDVLGQHLVAYGIGEINPERIDLFARLEDSPEEEAEKVLRDMAEVTEVLTERDTPDVARAIMIGMNPCLNDRAPIDVMHDGESKLVVINAIYLLGN